MGLSDLGDVGRPVLPIVTPPALLNYLGHDGLRELVKEKDALDGISGLDPVAAAVLIVGGAAMADIWPRASAVLSGRELVAYGNDLNMVRHIHAEVGLVYHRVESLVVRPERVQY